MTRTNTSPLTFSTTILLTFARHFAFRSLLDSIIPTDLLVRYLLVITALEGKSILKVQAKSP